MRKTVHVAFVSAAVALLAAAMCLAQSTGEATYKAKCASCHGPAGIPSPAMVKATGVLPITDPAVKNRSEAIMINFTKKGVGKMPGYAGKLSDAEIKTSVAYFRTLIK
jgi:cytochrome c6